MYSTFAAVSGLAFFFGLRTTGFAIVELPFRGARSACDGPGWSDRICQVARLAGQVVRVSRGSERRVVVVAAGALVGAAAPATTGATLTALTTRRAGRPRVVSRLAAPGTTGTAEAATALAATTEAATAATAL